MNEQSLGKISMWITNNLGKLHEQDSIVKLLSYVLGSEEGFMEEWAGQ
jgi:hypothetical protein